MSIRVMAQVWATSRMKGSALLLQLAIADFAHDDGGGAFPSIETLAEKIRMSPRQVKRLVKILERAGEIVATRSGELGRANTYVVRPGGVKMSPPQGVTGVTPGVSPMSPQPSGEPEVVRTLDDLPGTAWWRSLAKQYPYIDLAAELAKAKDWHGAAKVKSPKLFFRNWIERAAKDRPARLPTGSVQDQIRDLSARMAVPA